MSVFIYLAPVPTALGLHFFVKSERLSVLQWAGVSRRSRSQRSPTRGRSSRFAPGVASGVVLLGEPLSARFGLAALAVGAGIALVNLGR